MFRLSMNLFSAFPDNSAKTHGSNYLCYWLNWQYTWAMFFDGIPACWNPVHALSYAEFFASLGKYLKQLFSYRSRNLLLHKHFQY